jgi:hypothetical protein
MHFIKTDAKNRHDIDMDQVPTDATLASDFQHTFFLGNSAPITTAPFWSGVLSENSVRPELA